MRTSTYAIPSRWRLIFRDLNVPVQRVLRRADLPADWFHQVGPRAPISEFHRMWQGLAEELGEEQVPQMMAEMVRIEWFDPALFAATCSPDLNHALSRIARYKPLVGPIRLAVEQSEHQTRLTIRWPVLHPPPVSMGQAEVLWWVALARLATRSPLRPIHIAGPHPANVAAFAGVEMQEGADWSVTFSALDAARPFLTAHEGMWQFFEPELRRRLSALTESATTRERVRATLLELLPAGDVAMTTVARRLCTSKRTLQRRLSAEGTTFQIVLNETREALARHYLSSSQLPAAEISFLLGYADPNSFYRAFQSWTGTTPEAHRARAAS